METVIACALTGCVSKPRGAVCFTFDDYHGDGWRLVSEDSKEITNNPFKELKDMLGEE